MTTSTPVPDQDRGLPDRSKGQHITHLQKGENVQALIALLRRQRDAYEQLRGLSGQQGPLIDEGSAEALLGVLSQRQRLVDTLAGLNRGIEPYRMQWSQFLEGLVEDDREQIGGLVRDVEGLLSGIIEQDERDRRRLEASKQVVGKELGRVAHSSAAMNAYKVSTASSGARFTDRQG